MSFRQLDTLDGSACNTLQTAPWTHKSHDPIQFRSARIRHYRYTPYTLKTLTKLC